MASLITTAPKTVRRRKDLHTIVRDRAAKLFDPPPAAPPRPGGLPEPPSPPPVGLAAPPARPPRASRRDGPAGEPPPGLPDVPGPAAAGLRGWLYVRCGVEPKTVAALAVVLVAAVAFAAHHFWTGRPETVAVPPVAAGIGRPSPSPGAEPSAAAGVKTGGVVVDVAGKVRRPGVRTLPAGSRVADAVKAAGGALPGADTSGLNLARVLADGEQVMVGAPAPATSGGPGTSAAPISLSTASPEQLETLPGVGPVLAQHIVDYRTQHGGFRSVDQLNDVTGIGDRRFTDLKPLVTP